MDERSPYRHSKTNQVPTDSRNPYQRTKPAAPLPRVEDQLTTMVRGYISQLVESSPEMTRDMMVGQVSQMVIDEVDTIDAKDLTKIIDANIEYLTERGSIVKVEINVQNMKGLVYYPRDTTFKITPSYAYDNSQVSNSILSENILNDRGETLVSSIEGILSLFDPPEILHLLHRYCYHCGVPREGHHCTKKP